MYVQGINLPGTPIDLPALTEKDKKDLVFGVQQGVDLIAASFIRKADDVLEIRKVKCGRREWRLAGETQAHGRRQACRQKERVQGA